MQVSCRLLPEAVQTVNAMLLFLKARRLLHYVSPPELVNMSLRNKI